MAPSVPHSLWYPCSFMARIIAIVNQKGGVGKTTTAINLGASLAAADVSVLLVDFDPQGNTTSGVGIDKDRCGFSVYDLINGRGRIQEVITATALHRLQILPANRDLTGATVELLQEPERIYQLRDILQPLRDDFDFILVDCPPSLGILTLNALSAADSLLIPIQCEYFALEGLSELLRTMERVQVDINPGLEVEGVVLTMYDERLNLSGQIQADVREHLGDVVFETVIPRNVRLAESPSFGKPVLLYAARSTGANAYLALAREFLARCSTKPIKVKAQ